jgi:DNA-binding NtrC family response regulator
MSHPAPAVRSLPLLVVEDEPAVSSFMCTALQRAGYETVQAGTGVEALRLLAAGTFRGVISDMRTPGGVNGADVHDWISANRPELLGRVMFVTGDTVSDETFAMLQKTGAPCLEKPFRVNQLLSVAERMFGAP